MLRDHILGILFAAATATVLGPLDDGHLGVHRQADVELVLIEEIDVQGPEREDLTDLREEIGVFELAMRADINDGDIMFNRHGDRARGGIGGLLKKLA